jgi:hypothetical protein
MRRGVVAVGFTLLAWIAGDVRAELVCVAPSGALAVRATRCGRHERSIDVQQAGTPGVTGSKGAPGGFPMEVVDAAGKVVGDVVLFDPFRGPIQLFLDGSPFPAPQIFFVERTGAFEGELYYQALDCVGTPFVAASPFFATAQVIGDVVYYAAGPGSPMMLKSFETQPDNCHLPDSSPIRAVAPHGGCCVSVPDPSSSFDGIGPVAPAVTVPLATLGVTLPTTVRPR